MEVNRLDCDKYHSDLVNYVAGKQTCAITAIEKSDSQDWPDAKPKLMLVTAGSTNQQLHYKVKRNGNLHTVMPGITLCCDTLPPLVVTKRVILDADLHSTGHRAWIIDVLIPYVDSLRPTMLGENEEAANANSDVRTQAQTISRLVAAMEAATTPSQNRSAFKRAAITSELIDGRYVARIDEAEFNARMAELFLGELHQN
ncbi:MAG: hypothetical protein EZS28_002441 [Streblomastix strix]|uniref:DDE-1 domain-containing protein n=1 Tax=Streblomastix strix TaxID=222440 RepID=A0A5J4X696_9EUKA|nr:MAG: hypothetical protein EZS28_002441 [Streblomastix strix]